MKHHIQEKMLSSPGGRAAVEEVDDIFRSARENGVTLWLDGDNLRYQGPKGSMTDALLELIRWSKGEVVARLKGAGDSESFGSSFISCQRPNRAPLAFSQMAHWNAHRLYERPSMRQIASSTCLEGRLDVDALRSSLNEIVRRHDALHTRIVTCDGVPLQEVYEPYRVDLKVDDLTEIPEKSRQSKVIELVEQLILEPVDLAKGPLFGARLLKLRCDQHVLVLALDHMISDAFSAHILLRDLFLIYGQLLLPGVSFSLPEITLQFPGYSIWLREVQKSRASVHGEYWSARVASCPRVNFPEDVDSESSNCAGWGTVPIHIDKNLKAELREWCRVNQTTLAMSVFIAYVALVLRWCRVSDAVFQYQADGRVSQKIENTIGYFAVMLHLRVEVSLNDTFVDLLNRVTNEYCKAHEHPDFSYLEAQVPRPQFAHNAIFNWIPQESKIDVSILDGTDYSLTAVPMPFAHPTLRSLDRDNEPALVLFDTDDVVVGGVHFPLNRFSLKLMERFRRNFFVFIEVLLRRKGDCVENIPLSS